MSAYFDYNFEIVSYPVKSFNVRAKRTFLDFAKITFLMILGILISSCSSVPINPQGGQIKASSQIPISPGAQQSGYYQGPDLLVKYQYLLNGNTMEITGTIRFASSIQMNFTIIRYFNLQLLLADSQGVILATRNIAGATFRRTQEELHFRDSFVVPAGAKVMAFAYSGRATEGAGSSGRHQFGEGGGTGTDFFEYPVLK